MGSNQTEAAAQALTDLQDAIARTQTIIERISADQWGAPTPCAGVDVRALVNHLVAGNLHFARLVIRTAAPDGDADVLGADPAAAFRAAAANLMTAFRASDLLERTYPLPFGEVPGLGLIELRLIEHLGHGWDLAKATGQPDRFPGSLAEHGLTVARRQLKDRPAGEHRPYGPEVQVPSDAPAIERLAGFLGRDVLAVPLSRNQHQPSSAARIRSCSSVSGMRAASAGLSLMVPLPAASSGWRAEKPPSRLGETYSDSPCFQAPTLSRRRPVR